jgi:4-azaleucine resistance transporter AzlC
VNRMTGCSNDDGGFSGTSAREGFKAAWPICVGYFPTGLAFGVLAEQAGIHPLAVGLMSLVVFAGSSQFIAVSMLNSGSAVVSIVVTTFVVNLRHVLMSSSLATHLQGLSRKFLFAFAFGVTDECFAVNTTRFRLGGWHPDKAILVNYISWFAWVGSTVMGGYAGQFIPKGSFGIDYALSALFLCLLAFQLHGSIYAVTAVISGFLALALSFVISGNGYIVLASVVAATFGLSLRKYLARGQTAHAKE